MAQYNDENYMQANFIDHGFIESVLAKTESVTDAQIDAVIEKAAAKNGLSYEDIAVLLKAHDPRHIEKIYRIASQIKRDIYGNRVVIFAPLYVSNYCVNDCTYCGYKRDNKFPRRRLSESEIREEVRILERMGHKRIALEAGEDPVNCDIDYIIEALETIYDEVSEGSNIRRANVNIASTTVENYRKLKAANIDPDLFLYALPSP